MIKLIKLFFSNMKKQITEEHVDFYQKMLDLEQKYDRLLEDVIKLQEENIETTNVLYEIMENIRAIDARIDIVMEEKK